MVLADTNLAPVGSSSARTPSRSPRPSPSPSVTGPTSPRPPPTASSPRSSGPTRDDPVLAANQLLAALEFIHFENPFKTDARGIVLEPQGSWLPSSPAFLTTLLEGMSGNPALQPVTLSQFFSQVHKGGNDEPASRHLQSGPAPRVITAGQANAARHGPRRTSPH